MLAEEKEPMLEGSDVALAQEFQQKYQALLAEVHRVIIGQDKIIEQLLTVLFARGHALIIGVPGLAKTLLVKTLAGCLGWQFKRIQFTPDLMPSDITGTEILQTDPQTGERVMRFVKGPLFANLILADEINRTPPKTQAALLEAMQESTVTAAGRTFRIEPPFFVVATQNPIEHEGTYPLPEAQLDRFMYSIHVSYPEREEEIRIVDETTVLEFAIDLARASRPMAMADNFIRQYVEWGAGPRAPQCLVLGARTLALLRGLPTPSCREVRDLAAPVLQHRIIPNYNASGDGIDAQKIIERLLNQVKEATYK